MVFFFLSELWCFVHFQGICPLPKLLNLLLNLMQSMQRTKKIIGNKDNYRNQLNGNKYRGKTNETKICSFEKINKINKPLTE